MCTIDHTLRYHHSDKECLAIKGIFVDPITQKLVVFDRETNLDIQILLTNSKIDEECMSAGTVISNGSATSELLKKQLDGSGFEIEAMFEALGWEMEEFKAIDGSGTNAH